MSDYSNQHRQELHPVKGNATSSSWIYGAVVALAAVIGIAWYMTGSNSTTMTAPPPATQEAPAASAPAPAPAAEPAPAAPAAEPAPATPPASGSGNSTTTQ